jgi:6-phosphogluconolactonase
MPARFAKEIAKDANAVTKLAAEKIAETLSAAAAKKGRATIALAGGSTPKAAYALLASEPLVKKVPWDKLHIYFGDERHVRPDNPDSNYRMAHEAMLKTAPISKENVFPIATDGKDVVADAERFEKLLKANFPGSDFPSFDLMLLGIGPDGHTASLFPGTPAPKELKKWATWCDPNSANPAIKPPVKRVTVTTPVIWNAAQIFVLATGAEKTPMLSKIFSEAEPTDPPVSRLLRQCKGTVTFFLDEPAAKF